MGQHTPESIALDRVHQHQPIFFNDHPVASCVDLRATFAGQFRLTWDPSYDAERPDWRKVEAAWLTRIPCRFGFIAPHGGRRLMAYTTTRRRALAALPCVTPHQVGDGEILVTFDVGDIEAVAEVLGAKRPRQISEATRARLRRQGFQPHRGTISRAGSSDLRPDHAQTHAPETRWAPGAISGQLQRPPAQSLKGEK